MNSLGHTDSEKKAEKFINALAAYGTAQVKCDSTAK